MTSQTAATARIGTAQARALTHYAGFQDAGTSPNYYEANRPRTTVILSLLKRNLVVHVDGPTYHLTSTGRTALAHHTN